MIVVLVLTLNIDTIILGCILSMLLSDFRTREAFQFLLWRNLFMLILRRMSIHFRDRGTLFLLQYDSINVRVCMLCLHYTPTANVVNSSRWPILFKVQTLSVAISTVLLLLSNFCLGLGLSSVADFSNTEVRASISAEHGSCFPARRATRSVYRVIVIFRLLYFYRIHP